MTLRNRIEQLDKIVPPLPEPKPEVRASAALVDLLLDAIDAAASEFSDDEAARVNAAMAEPDDYRNPYVARIRTLRKGDCRIPEVTPAIMRDVMLGFAEPRGDRQLAAMVCNECGMFLPRDVGACPICGTGKRDDGIWDRHWLWLARGTAHWLGLDRHLNAPTAKGA